MLVRLRHIESKLTNSCHVSCRRTCDANHGPSLIPESSTMGKHPLTFLFAEKDMSIGCQVSRGGDYQQLFLYSFKCTMSPREVCANVPEVFCQHWHLHDNLPSGKFLLPCTQWLITYFPSPLICPFPSWYILSQLHFVLAITYRSL